jgi:CDP-glucose 4,6-dehydratase
MRYFITGHTGFKGSWLVSMLSSEGHEVHGYALDPLPGSLFELADLGTDLSSDTRNDVRDPVALARAIETVQPDVVVHMAAQPLVRDSYREPRLTIETNVMGTLNVLEAASKCSQLQALVIVTTDKVYRNVGRATGYVEYDPLGGDDPYSASKSMADILTHAWSTSFPGAPTLVVRAGNVIGGGDVSRERLMPDIISALESGSPIEIRYPNAVRPWQHVLDCLNGYRRLIEATVEAGATKDSSGPWNFGPDDESVVPVRDLVNLAYRLWGSEVTWSVGDNPEYAEAGILLLDSSKARSELGWSPVLSLDEAVAWTIEWSRAVNRGESARQTTLRQVADFRARQDVQQ